MDGQQTPPGDGWPTVGIVVLNWENYGDTAECLDSLESLAYPEHEVFVVDNGSTDGSGERIDDEFEWVEVIYNDDNRGAAGGNNPGVARVLDEGFDHVLLLNEDTVLPSDFLFPLVETMESEENVAAVGGRQYNPETGNVVNVGVWFLPFLGGLTRVLKSPLKDHPYGSAPIPPFLAFQYVPTSMMLLNGDFAATHDVFCEDYFIGMEDVDLAYQAHRDGWKVLVNPDAEIYHKEGRTIEWSTFKTYHWVRNRLQFASNRLPIYFHVPFLLSLALLLGWLCLQWYLDEKRGHIQAALVGVADYVADDDFRDYEFFN
ncbi:hypothetical protein SAMN04487947_4030 [Halogeometricum rufum]|uniref:Glycosyltransferase 2-like domain-containing protein n=1 Tax=Halogeometricum rufum TaxID=553469 RepID=A0A1I6J4H4_9EURY|nr:glycosyltransferase family 2 protein [Halogeometricum rufum]SFR73839.1 hypothetical protein SAMN04487947_4030 [Halogeometricum rufum]